MKMRVFCALGQACLPGALVILQTTHWDEKEQAGPPPSVTWNMLKYTPDWFFSLKLEMLSSFCFTCTFSHFPQGRRKIESLSLYMEPAPPWTPAWLPWHTIHTLRRKVQSKGAALRASTASTASVAEHLLALPSDFLFVFLFPLYRRRKSHKISLSHVGLACKTCWVD